MARQRSPNRDKAFEMWRDSNGSMQLVEIAVHLGVKDSLVRKWKNQDKWEEQLNGNVTNGKGNVTIKKGAPKGNKNAVGNSGGAAPKGNSNAVTHGFFRRIFPDDEETLAIVDEIGMKSPIDMIWENIVIQYTAIARAQKLMFVRDQDDMTKELKKEKNVSSEKMDTTEVEYEIQFAWDKHANFLQAQSRAMVALQGLIKQFDDMAHIDDERRLKLGQMRLGIKKTEAEIGKLAGNGEDKPIEIVIKRKGERS